MNALTPVQEREIEDVARLTIDNYMTTALDSVALHLPKYTLDQIAAGLSALERRNVLKRLPDHPDVPCPEWRSREHWVFYERGDSFYG